MRRPYDSGVSRHRVVELAAAIVGSVLVLAALVIIWAARSTIARDVYVSEMGAPGQPTARWFQLSLVFIAAGGALVAYAGRDIRSRLRVLRAWAPSVSIWIGCALFLLTSQVTCTAGCPIPVGIAFTWQDFVHTTAAVLAFAAACWGMLQTSFSVGRRALSAFSLIAAISVALIAGAGGLFSLFSFQANLGSRLELIATTIALAWLLVLGVFASARLISPPGPATPLLESEADSRAGHHPALARPPVSSAAEPQPSVRP